MNFVLGYFLLKAFVFANGIISDKSVPTVVVVISDSTVQCNPNIPLIFQKMQGYPDGLNQASRVQFQTVVSQNETATVEKVCEYLASGVFAVIDISTPRLAALLKSACQAFGITYISMVDPCYFNYPLTREDNDVMIDPAATQMLMVVADIVVKANNLTNVAIVHDDSFDIQNTPRRILTNIPAQHVYMSIDSNVTETANRVNTIVKINIKAIFVIADNIRSQHFLTLLYEKNVTNFDPHVFVLTKDSTFSCGSCSGNHRLLLIRAQTSSAGIPRFIDFMRRSLNATDYQPAKVKVDEALAFDVARLVINAVSNLTATRGDVHNIAHLDCYSESTVNGSSVEQSRQLADAMTQSTVAGVFGPMSWDRQENIIRYSITLTMDDILLEAGTQTSDVAVASWTRDKRITMIAGSLIKEETKKTYRVVAAAEYKPFVYKNVLPNGTVEYTGYCIDLLNKIATSLNFHYTIYDTEEIGSMDEDGQWSGVIGELTGGRADIAVGPISVMAERENVIDFTVPYYDLVGLTILMKRPKFDYSLVKFLSVLDENVWGCIIGAFFLFSVLITVFDKLSPFSYQNRRAQWKETGPEPKVFTLKEGIWFCMMSLTPQGGGETPKALSGRLIAATWWLFGFIIIATYTANLAAFLTVSRLETPVESLDDLSKQSKIKYAPVNGSTSMLYFKRMADIEQKFYEIWKDMSLNDNLPAAERAKLAVWDYPVSDKYTKLWETMLKTGLPDTKAAAINRVLSEDFAYISDATTNKYQTIINCDLAIVGEEFSRKPYALAVQEGSPLRSQISTTILALINDRTLEQFKTRWWAEDKKSCPTLDDESDGISIHNIGGVFLVIVIGSGLSLITLAFECYWYRYRPERRRKALANASNRRQMTSSMTSPKDNKSSENNLKSKPEHSGLGGHVGLDAGFTFSEFELNDSPVDGRGNTSFEQTERF